MVILCVEKGDFLLSPWAEWWYTMRTAYRPYCMLGEYLRFFLPRFCLGIVWGLEGQRKAATSLSLHVAEKYRASASGSPMGDCRPYGVTQSRDYHWNFNSSIASASKRLACVLSVVLNNSTLTHIKQFNLGYLHFWCVIVWYSRLPAKAKPEFET